MQKKEKQRRFIHYLPVYGCISTGIVYLAIGIIAILSFLRIKQGGADESSLMAFLNEYLAGKILIWIILLGTVSYIIWRIFESIKDPYEYGKETKGIAIRTGVALSSIADVFIVYSTVQIMLGNGEVREDGQPDEQREMVAGMLQESWGGWLVIGIGVVVCLMALVQFYYGITKGYKERLETTHFSARTESLVHFLAWVGYFARGIIIAIIGYFFIKAGISNDAGLIVNTDKAFDFIGDDIGHVFFILVALGTICYGLFMFTHGVAYDADKD